jgi:hypothetical protein
MPGCHSNGKTASTCCMTLPLQVDNKKKKHGEPIIFPVIDLLSLLKLDLLLYLLFCAAQGQEERKGEREREGEGQREGQGERCH